VQTPAEQAAFDLRRPQQQVWQPIILGVFASFYLAMFMAIGGPVPAFVGFAGTVGGATIYALRRKRRQLREASGRALNSAFNLIGLGRLRDASEVLDEVEVKSSEPWALRLADIQRAIIAIRRGEVAPAEAHLSSAIERPLVGYARENATYQLEGAYALRAFVRAALGRHEDARADIAHVESGNPSDDARARVALTEAMILEQQGKREELRMLLTQKSALLLEHTHPRERAIVRAFQRMVRSDRASVYRRAEVARREKVEGEEPMLTDWVAKVAPGAADFVRSPRPAEQVARIAPMEAVARPTEEAIRANTEAKKPVKKGSWKRPLLGLAAVAAAVTGLVELFTMDAPNVADTNIAAGAPGASSAMSFFLLTLVVMVPVVYAVVRALRWLGRVRAEKEVRDGAKGARAAGPPNEDQLRALTDSPSPVVGAQAWLMLADRAERRGDFHGALHAATSGLARLSDPRDRAAADIVYPDLLSLRAFALAACGRFQESNAELASLGPAYPHFSRAVFRARLLVHVRGGDLRGAAHWVEQGEADLPLSVREELLADLVRAAVSPEQAGAGEIQRLKDELAASPEAKAWIRVAAPGLLERFEGATMTDMRMRIDAVPDREQLAEEEAAAALEGQPMWARSPGRI
jgi:tetratricopeptide (TPR) repeat protein